MAVILPSSDVSAISGVGKTRKEQLNKLNIFTVKDLLFHFPRQYENRGNVTPLSEATLDSPNSFVLTVATEVKTVALKKGVTISKFRVFDESGTAEIVFFNSPYVKDIFHTGSLFRFYGRLSVSQKKLQITNPKYEPIVNGIPLSDFVPVYPLTEGISTKFLDKIISAAINEALPFLDDPLPEKIRLKNSLPTLSYAIKNIHFPEDEKALQKAVKRLAFDEMFCFAISISKVSHTKSLAEGYKFNHCDLTPLLKLLPYELTDSQKKAVNDIYKDTVKISAESPCAPMSRIVVGDVGCGKTICALISIYIAVKSGYQAALMAPTEILARQHFNEASELFEKLGINVRLLVGSTKSKEKQAIYTSLSEGELSVVVGTHALLSDKLCFKKLGLIITDEQHRFGVNQRAVLKEKTKSANMLVMSATPIPRSLALTLYGDLDISRITEMPKGRMRVDTFVVDESYRERLLNFIAKQIKLGGQCYVVCPSIESSDDEDTEELCSLTDVYNEDFSSKEKLKNALEFTEFLKQNLIDIRIACLHGKMKAAQKDEIMAAFSRGEIDLLVSTTVIEVGVNVPNASLMIIENAERFGMSQIHQLRGRVGRGARKSYCVLVEGSKSEKSAQRLEIMRTTYDGFEIAEKDLLLRGPGDFFAMANSDSAIRQSGGFDFKMASLGSDIELMNAAFSSAKALIKEDPELQNSENQPLYKEISSILSSDFSTIS